MMNIGKSGVVKFVKAAALAAFALGAVSSASIASAQARRPAAAQVEQPADDASPGVVNLNTASEEELMRLPGIGPAKAAAILELRQRVGGQFRRIEDVLRVRGIGRATFRRLRPMLTLQGATTLVEQHRTRRPRNNDDADVEAAAEETP